MSLQCEIFVDEEAKVLLLRELLIIDTQGRHYLFENSIRIQIFIANNDEFTGQTLEPLSLSLGVLRCLDDVLRGVLQVQSAAAPG